MADNSLERASLTCPVCLDLLSNPVTIPCGHSFCLNCIQNSWRDERDRYPCPECRKRFSSRPDLNKNIMLAKLVEQIIKSTPPSDQYAGPQDVSCDGCTGRKLKAAKSCLQCVVSFCESHLQPHRDVPMLQKHQLVAPCHKLQENICHEHNEVKKNFCRMDKLPICVVCSRSQQHKGHIIVSSADERAIRQAELEVNVDLLRNRVLLKEADQRWLDEKNQYSSQSAKCAEVQCTNTFGEITELLKNIQIEVYQHINSEKSREILQNTRLRHKLGKEVLDLKQSISELEELAKIQQDNHFLLLYPSAPSPPSADSSSAPSPSSTHTDAQATGTQCEALQPTDTQEDKDTSSILTRPPMDFDYVTRAMKAFKDKFPLSLNEFKLPEPEVPLPAPEPVTRKDLLCYGREIALDQNTAHSLMFVSNNDRKVVFIGKACYQAFKCEEYPDEFMQVLSKYGMTGRSYWEVDVSQTKYVCIAVSYKDSEGDGCANQWAFGQNDKSWALKYDNGKYLFCFDSVHSEIMGPIRSVIGVYLDHSAGILSFYSVSEGMATLLHKVQTIFTLPLYAGIGLHNHCDSVSFRKLRASCK